MAKIMQIEREKNANTFIALHKFPNFYLMLTLRTLAGLHLKFLWKKTVIAQSMSGNTFLIAAVQSLWINMYHFYLQHFVYRLTSNEASSQGHKTRQNFHMICNYQALCMSVWQVMKLLHIFIPILSIFFFSLPCCLLHLL